MTAALWVPATRSCAWQRDYSEAESVMESVRELAIEMQRFAEERGRMPQSFDDLASFSPEHDFTVLRRYPHEFSSTGSSRFFVRINSRFALAVDERYNPTWWQWTGMLEPPTNPR